MTRARPASLRSVLGSVLLVLASGAACLIAVDLVLLLWHGPVRAVENFYVPDPRYGYRMRPDLNFVFASPYNGYRANVHTNHEGLRDDEVAVPKPAGVFRVLLLGDSMTAGFEVDKSQTFEAVAEARLRARGPVEVINSGVRGYNLDNILGFLRDDGLRYEPDVVVYLFVDNDLTSESTYRPETADASRAFTLHGLLGRLGTYSHLTYRAEIARQMLAMRRRQETDSKKQDAYVHAGILALFTDSRYDSVPLYQWTAARIGTLQQLCAERGATFVLAGAPHREEVDPQVQDWWRSTLGPQVHGLDFDGVRHFLAWVTARYDIARLDPVPDFRTLLPRDGNYWFPHDAHLNPGGHRLLGSLLAARIESLPAFQGWLRKRGSPGASLAGGGSESP